jgi:hypothetical protein
MIADERRSNTSPLLNIEPLVMFEQRQLPYRRSGQDSV